MGKRNLFINTTPVGMFPEINSAPEIPYELLSENDFLFDLIYNPSETLFLKKGKERNCKIKNGLEMLELQAEKSWEIWQQYHQLERQGIVCIKIADAYNRKAELHRSQNQDYWQQTRTYLQQALVCFQSVKREKLVEVIPGG